MQQLFDLAYEAKAAPGQPEFLNAAKAVVFLFFGVRHEIELKQKLMQHEIQTDLADPQTWINVISGLWDAASKGHPNRHAVERLIERMTQEKWWPTISTMRQYNQFAADEIVQPASMQSIEPEKAEIYEYSICTDPTGEGNLRQLLDRLMNHPCYTANLIVDAAEGIYNIEGLTIETVEELNSLAGEYQIDIFDHRPADLAAIGWLSRQP